MEDIFLVVEAVVYKVVVILEQEEQVVENLVQIQLEEQEQLILVVEVELVVMTVLVQVLVVLE